jgi:hypothetical protein
MTRRRAAGEERRKKEAGGEKREEGARVSSRTSAFHWRGGANAVPRLTQDGARELVHLIAYADTYEAMQALCVLLSGIEYEPDAALREGLTLEAINAAYSKTFEFSESVNQYVTRAAMMRGRA